MSNELPKNNNKSEEVDLIVFFNLIGSTFEKLFSWVGSIFKSLFGVLIMIVGHFYKRALWYGLVVIIGFVTGWFIDRKAEKLYGANMFIATNYNSGYQVYENMKNLNELANVDRDTVELAKIFNLKPNEASALKGFYIQPDIDPLESVQLFSDFREGLDSIAKSEAKYDDFVSNMNRFNYKTHRIGVASTDKSVFSKLNNVLPKLISKNPYLDRAKKIGQENYLREENTLIDQQKKIDSLVNVYLQIRNRESNKLSKSGGGMNLYLGNAQKNELLVNEANLLQEKLILEEQRREVISKKNREEDIISVISNFPSSGYDISEWYWDKKIQLPTLLFGMLLLFFLLIALGKFLKNKT